MQNLNLTLKENCLCIINIIWAISFVITLAEVSRNLAKYRSENNFVGLSK